MKQYIFTLLLLVMCGAAPQLASADKVSYTYDDAGRLLRANYASGTVVAYTYDAAGSLLSRVVAAAVTPTVNAGGTVNAASFTARVAAGSVTSVFGTNLAAGSASATVLPLPTTLGGTSLTLNSTAAPLFFLSPLQANFQIPWELEGQSQASITVTSAGGSSVPQTINLATFAPGIFTLNQAGSGQGAVLIASSGEVAAPSGSIPGRASRPAARGEFISVYCVGLGPVNNRPASGVAGPSQPLATSTTPVTATIGGLPSTVSFSGLAPTFVGLYQVNVGVPDNAATSDAAPLVITIGGVTSNTVTIAVQ